MAGTLPPEARARAVLVRGIPPTADEAVLDEFFSFCGAIESKSLSPVPPPSAGDAPSLEAVVVFLDDASRRTALLMSESTILDVPVTITGLPDGYAGPQEPAAGPTGLGGLFASVGLGGVFGALTGEMEKAGAQAGALLGAAGESDVVRNAKEGAAAAAAKSAELVRGFDAEYKVGARAGAVAGAVGERTRDVFGEIDERLHVVDAVKGLKQKAMENDAVSSGIEGIKSGLDWLLSQTGLAGASSNGDRGDDGGVGGSDNASVDPAAAPGTEAMQPTATTTAAAPATPATPASTS